MFRNITLGLVVAAITHPTLADPATQSAPKPVEVCFVLDTTGSMSGLIDGAKRKIWSIANSIVAANHGGSVKFALVPYRDRGDQYVTKVFALTDDLDKVFQDLQTLEAGGGGDEPESVNQALDDAVGKIKWSDAKDVTKIIFLVGDAPPHMDYVDDVKYPQTCEAAVNKRLVINSVQCGAVSGTREQWEKIAKLAEGSYVALEQSGNMETVQTPMDAEIAELSNKISALAMPYGSAQQQAEVGTKLVSAASAPAAVAADRAYYNSASLLKAVQGRGDLISDIREKQVKLEDIKSDELPKDLQNLPREQQLAKINEQAAKRDELSKKVAELSLKRQAFIDAEKKKQAASGHGDAFDEKVAEIVQKDLSRAK
jgi:hypothetical protein